MPLFGLESSHARSPAMGWEIGEAASAMIGMPVIEEAPAHSPQAVAS
jgi:hypothetical protein